MITRVDCADGDDALVSGSSTPPRVMPRCRAERIDPMLSVCAHWLPELQCIVRIRRSGMSPVQGEPRVHLPSRSLVVAHPDGIEIDGRRWVRCANWHDMGCNWVTPAELGVGEEGFVGGASRAP